MLFAAVELPQLTVKGIEGGMPHAGWLLFMVRKDGECSIISYPLDSGRVLER